VASRSPKHVGRQLRHVRRKQGLSRAEVARSAGLTRRELAAYERGRVEIPDSDLWCLAGSCGVDVGELLPQRDPLRIDSSLSSLAIGDTIRQLRAPAEPDGVLREYLAMIYELRNLPPGTRVPLREADLSTLADALGGTPEVIEARLVELVGTNREEAARLRAMILPPLSIDAGEVSTLAPPDGGSTDSLAAAIHTDPAPQVDDFFAAPRADDPFSNPPFLDVVGAPDDATAVDVTAPREPSDPLASLPVDPFATPFSPEGPAAAEPEVVAADALGGVRADPFAPPGAVASPLLELPGPNPDGIVVDLPEASLDATAETLSPIIPDRDLWTMPDATHRHDGDLVGPATEHATETVVDALAPIAAADAELLTPIVWHASLVDACTDTPSAAPTTLAHAGSAWQVGGLFPATAMADDGALALRRADTRWVLSDLSAPGDFTAEAVVDFVAGTGFGILFRAGLDGHEQLSGYSFDIDAIAGGGGYLVRHWEANRPHWRPLAHAQVVDPARLLGHHTIRVTVLGDSLTVDVDGETVLATPSLSRASIELGREPCHGERLGIQAAATTEVTVDRLSATQH
jgi:transcriptional regulator with XRE-family HTH domain